MGTTLAGATPKAKEHLRAQGRLILEEGIDIVVMQEVEDMETLKLFNQRYLKSQYEPLLIDGNDPRGIDVCFLVRRDLPLRVEYRSNRHEKWVDPILGPDERHVFSRDLPILILRVEGSEKPVLVMAGAHLKSKRTRDSSDPESNIKRGGETQRAAEILARLQTEFGPSVPILFGADFNGDVNSEKEFAILKSALALEDSLNLSDPPASPWGRVTHTWFPRGAPAHYSQFDALLVSPALRPALQDSYVYRYKDEKGKPKPIPRKMSERKKNPSDHFPVIAIFDFQKMLEMWRR